MKKSGKIEKKFSNFSKDRTSLFSNFFENNEEMLEGLPNFDNELKNIIINLSKKKHILLKENSDLKNEIKNLIISPNQRNLNPLIEQDLKKNGEISLNINRRSLLILLEDKMKKNNSISLDNIKKEENLVNAIKFIPFYYAKSHYLNKISFKIFKIKRRLFKPKSFEKNELFDILKNSKELYESLSSNQNFIVKNVLNKSLDKLNGISIRKMAAHNLFSIRFVDFKINESGFTEFYIVINDKMLQKQWEFKSRFSVFQYNTFLFIINFKQST